MTDGAAFPTDFDPGRHGLPFARARDFSGDPVYRAQRIEAVAKVEKRLPQYVPLAYLNEHRSVVERLAEGRLLAFGRPDNARQPFRTLQTSEWRAAPIVEPGALLIGGTRYWDVYIHDPQGLALALALEAFTPPALTEAVREAAAAWLRAGKPETPRMRNLAAQMAGGSGRTVQTHPTVKALEAAHKDRNAALVDRLRQGQLAASWRTDPTAEGWTPWQPDAWEMLRLRTVWGGTGDLLSSPSVFKGRRRWPHVRLRQPALPDLANRPTAANRGGPKPRYDWPSVLVRLGAKVSAEGPPNPGDGGQAQLETWVANQFPPDATPAESEIRKWVSETLKQHRQALG